MKAARSFLLKFSFLLLSLHGLSACYALHPKAEEQTTQAIATLVNRENQLFIYLVSPDGSNHRELAIKDSDGKYYEDKFPPVVQWSPDGRSLLFTTHPEEPDGELTIINADGSDLKTLTNNQEIDYGASWSPDGKQIIYSHKTSNDEIQIRVMDHTGEKDRLFLKDAWDPHWSPDSKKIAFTSYAPNYFSQTIYLLSADGTGFRQRLSPLVGDNSEPAWSPDGQQLVYTHCQDSKQALCQLRLIQADGSQDRELTPMQAVHFSARWSTDGKELVYGAKEYTSDKAWIELISANGSGRRTLFADSGSSFGASWSPNSQEIVFHSKQENKESFQLAIIRRDGTGVRYLPAVPGEMVSMYWPSWSFTY